MGKPNSKIKMIPWINFLFILLFLIKCANTTTAELKKVSLENSLSHQKTITIKLNNFKDLKTKVKVSLQNLNSFAAENYKYEAEYSFQQTIEGDSITLEIPEGKFVGSISLLPSQTTPFYKSIQGFHTIYFGTNKNYAKSDYKEPNCFLNYFQGTQLFLLKSSANFCPILDLTEKNKNFEFSIPKEDELNPERTLWGLYLSISSAFAPAFVYYPYAPFLAFHGIFGATQNVVMIQLDKHDLY
ncbi:hypothetical protein JWG41_19715 [Leptospira sp. 201903075]|uniref:hypothetical protein n=1 Tax=Leptospira chreensis TaxID=2810035 RepID=UPI0019654947|nr:hypothetical protein [Leptospira chreensis]MBM9592493.1 hypothetical protein [Leptospira chreensis]MBM9592674.1 hypothetical protein [Leptospira chreensis]